MKNTWKGINNFPIKARESESTSLNSKVEVLTNLVDIAKSFNNFFCLVCCTKPSI